MAQAPDHCRRCGTPAHSAARYCWHCGAALARQPRGPSVAQVIVTFIIVFCLIVALAGLALVGACFAFISKK